MSKKVDYQLLWQNSNTRKIRGTEDFRVKYWQDLLGEKEVARLIAQARADLAEELEFRHASPIRIKHIDRSVLASIVLHGRTGAQSTVARDKGIGWYKHNRK